MMNFLYNFDDLSLAFRPSNTQIFHPTSAARAFARVLGIDPTCGV
jgi:hypothetical protein